MKKIAYLLLSMFALPAFGFMQYYVQQSYVALTLSTIDSTPIGATAPSTGSFTAANAQTFGVGTINSGPFFSAVGVGTSYGNTAAQALFYGATQDVSNPSSTYLFGGGYGSTNTYYVRADGQVFASVGFSGGSGSFTGGSLNGTFSGSPTWTGTHTFNSTVGFNGGTNFTGMVGIASTGALTATAGSSITLNGANVFGGTNTFNGTAAFTNGGSLNGTFSGSPTWSAGATFNGGIGFNGNNIFSSGTTNTFNGTVGFNGNTNFTGAVGFGSGASLTSVNPLGVSITGSAETLSGGLTQCPTGATGIAANGNANCISATYLTQTARKGSASCSPAATSYATCSDSITWAVPFADANYNPICWLGTPTGGGESLAVYESGITASGVSLTIQTQTSVSGSSASNIFCSATHP